MKKIGVSLLYTFISIVFLTFIVTLLNYFNLFNMKVLAVFKLLIPIVSVFIGSFILGRSICRKGYLEGIKYGFLISLIFLLLSLIFKIKIDFSNLLYYLILIASSIFGSIIGINTNKKST